MKVVWTREALADLEDIAAYYAANASPAIADTVGRRFADVIERCAPLIAAGHATFPRFAW
ncbi:type II toxin-antitoxin system RelE/ParE family toxin [Bradyrhizobium agreste]|uniref:type II toxin-antitoxin system RelE/ParE family toxin n=1 Tax=Bradyrhizobium agreste TaxID=2751811 RepID=UPI001FE5D356|nr:type II toxin-antitoxin system RelE/ParE family toxin [Bradyrhizobium agreste]